MNKPTLLNLAKACNFINDARRTDDPIAITTRLFYALEQLSEHYKFGISHTEAILMSYISSASKEESRHFLMSDAVKRLIEFTPRIRKEDYNFYRSNFEGSRKFVDFDDFATSAHRRFIQAISENDYNLEDVEDRLIRLLYVVRCNIAHGKKDPGVRNDEVCRTINPLLFAILDMILDYPEHRLLTYGTLSPGGSNQHVLEPVNAVTHPARVIGQLRDLGPYKAFVPTDSDRLRDGSRVEAFLHESEALSDYWHVLDDFEGPSYRRILVPYEIQPDNHEPAYSVAYIYSDSDSQRSPNSLNTDKHQTYCKKCGRWGIHI